MKRLLSILLALALCLSLLPMTVGVNAASADELIYEITDGQVTITGCDSRISGALVIPDTIEGCPVTAIGKRAFYFGAFKSVTVPASVTSIGDEAFKLCTELTSVTLSDGVVSIGDYAFDGCVMLPQVTIPGSVTSIGEYAFGHCYKLNEIRVAADNPAYKHDAAGALLDKAGTTLIQYPTNITGNYTVPEGVTNISEYAFDYGKLNSLTLSSSVTSIDSYLFYSCVTLKNIWVAEDNPAFKSDASGVLFDKNGTTLLRAPVRISGDYVIPEGVTHIGMRSFYSCSSLNSVTFPKSVTHIERDAFDLRGSLKCLYFAGNAPEFDYSFGEIKGTIYYHPGTTGWNASIFSELGSMCDFSLQQTDHIWSGYTYNNNHTCTTDGTELAVCLTCGEQKIRKVDGTAAHRFTYSSNHDATCTEDGTQTCICRICGFTETVTEIGSAGHRYSDYTSNNDATCTEDGTKTALCSVCGHADTIIDEGSAGHNYSDYTSNNDATCTKNGTKTAVCTACGHTDTVIDRGTALGHAYSEYTSNNDATCTEDGTLSSFCANCGDVKTVPHEGSALGHSFSNYVSDGNFTCTLDGTETAKCDRCEETHWRIEVGSADHRYLDGFCLFCGQAINAARLTGSLTTFGEGAVTLELTPAGESIPTSVYSTESDTYSIDTVSGDYFLTVSKEGHVTRVCAVTLADGQMLLDLMLQRPGDITADGRINVADVSRAYAHAKKTALLEGYSLLLCDLNNDGKTNVADVSMLYAHARKTTILW